MIQRTSESFMIANGSVGDYFYTDKTHNIMTSLATYYGRKITTEHCYCVPFVFGEKNTKVILKVTICE